jgi:beta-lactamase regulating signal transducer with metallopeptidase domain
VITAGLAAKAWLATLAMMTAQGTLLALVALVVTRASGKLRPAWQAAIWLVVVVKFALPWGPHLRGSLSDLIAMLTHQTPAADVVSNLPPALAPLPPAPHLAPAILWLVLASVWAAGALVVIVRAVRAHRLATGAARTAPVAPPFAQRLVATLAGKLGVRTPALHVGAVTVGPHVLGLVHTTIVVPPALLHRPELLRAALLHELAHVRRRDMLGRIAQVAATSLLWFWPIVRVVGRRLDAARETACDAWALETGEVARPTYARLLVRMAELRAATPAAMALAAPHALDARVRAVLDHPSHARIGRIQRIALAGWIVLALGGARTASAHERVVCKYTPALAQALYLSYPEADLDGDGQLSRDEACGLQAQLRRTAGEAKPQLASHLDPASEAELQTWLEEPLCCNCETPEANSGTCHLEPVGAEL